MSNNNLATELSLLALSLALIAAMVILLVIGKITWVEAVPFLTVVGGLYGVNSALKVPSPSQQQQISTQQESLQSLVSLLANHTHPAPPTPPSPPTQPVQPTPGTWTNSGLYGDNIVQPLAPVAPSPIDPGVSMAAYQTGMMPAVTPQVKP